MIDEGKRKPSEHHQGGVPHSNELLTLLLHAPPRIVVTVVTVARVVMNLTLLSHIFSNIGIIALPKEIFQSSSSKLINASTLRKMGYKENYHGI